MNSKIKLLIKWIIGLSILFTLTYKLDINQILNTLSKLNIIIILLVFAWISTPILNAYNYKIILNAMGIKLKFSKIIWYYMISLSLGKFTIGKLGEFSIVSLLKQEKIGYGYSTCLFVIDKLITFITLILIGSIGFFIFFEFNTAIKLLIISLIILIILLLSLRSPFIRSIIKKLILKEKAKDFKGFYKNIVYVIKTKKKALFADFIVTLLRFVAGGILIYILLLYFNISVPIPVVIIINSIGTIMALIPISISGLGIKESTVIYLYSLIGINPVIIGTIYILIRVVGFIRGIIILSISSKMLLKL